MSITSTDVPKLAITNANTSGDIVRAAKIDPVLLNDLLTGLMSALADKSLLGSKTFWVSIFTPVISWAVTYFALGLDGTTCGLIASVAASLAMMVMRYLTKTPVTSVLPQTKSP